MAIPYDLSPPSPDVPETFAEIGRWLAGAAPVPASSGGASESASGARFACLRSMNTPQAIVSIARDFTPRFERHGPSSVVLDVSGLGRLIGGPEAIGSELARAAAACAGSMRIAVAPTQTAARLLALAHPGLRVAAGDPAAAVAGLPVTVLRQYVEDGEHRSKAGALAALTAARRLVDTFERWGVRTLGEVAALPPADLSERMGQDGVALLRRARGIDDRPLVPDPGVARFVESIELEWPIEALEPLSFVLARLLDPLSAALERADRGAVAVRLDLRLVDRSTHARVLALPAAMRDPRVLRTLLLLDLESHPPAAGIDVVTLELDPAPARIVQYSLLERALPSPETLATLNARLGALVGEARCGSPSLLDTHRPDGFVMERFDPARRPARSAAAPVPGVGAGGRDHAAHGSAPGSAGPPVRRFRPPVAIRVTVERGRPVHVAIDRRGMPGGHVEQFAGPWRTSGAWWDTSGLPWDRDDWDVQVSGGTLCRLYRDRTTGQWFMDGYLD